MTPDSTSGREAMTENIQVPISLSAVFVPSILFTASLTLSAVYRFVLHSDVPMTTVIVSTTVYPAAILWYTSAYYSTLWHSSLHIYTISVYQMVDGVVQIPKKNICNNHCDKCWHSPGGNSDHSTYCCRNTHKNWQPVQFIIWLNLLLYTGCWKALLHNSAIFS